MNKRYLAGIYQAKSTNVFSNAEFDNFKQLNNNQFIDYLKNSNYAIGSNYNNIDEIIAKEISNIRLELNTLTNSTLLGNIFYTKNDLNNIKIVYKSLKYNLPIDQFDLSSTYSVEALVEFFKNDNKSLLKEEDILLFEQLKTIDSSSIKVELENIEKVYYNYYFELAKKEFPELVIYLETLNFINNLNNVLKLRSRKDSVENLSTLLLEQSIFPKSDWLEVFTLPEDLFKERISLYYYGKLSEGLNIYLDTNDLTALNKAYDGILNDVATNISFKHEALGPVFSYLHEKQNEANKLRGVYYESFK